MPAGEQPKAPTFAERLDLALPLPDPQLHRFDGVTQVGRHWRVSCACGVPLPPASSRDAAYEELTDHLRPQIEILVLREMIRKDPSLLPAVEAILRDGGPR